MVRHLLAVRERRLNCTREGFPILPGWVTDFGAVAGQRVFDIRIFKPLRSVHREHYAEPRLAAQHAIVGGSSLFEREGLDHGANPSEGTEV